MNRSEQQGVEPELDLVDIWIVVRRHFKLFLGIFTIAFLLGLIGLVLRTPKYDYVAIVQLGGIRNDSSGEVVPLTPPEQAIDIFKSLIIPKVLLDYSSTHPGFSPGGYRFDLSASKSGSAVTIQTRGTAEESALINQLLVRIVAEMTESQQEILRQRVDATKALLTLQIAKLETDEATLEKSRQQVEAHGTQADKAMTLLLLDDRITGLTNQIMKAQKELQVDLPLEVQVTKLITPPQRSQVLAGMGNASLLFVVAVVATLLGLVGVVVRHLRLLVDKRLSTL